MSAPAPPRDSRPPMDARFRARRRAVVEASARRRRRIAGSMGAVLVIVAGGIALSYSPLFAVDELRVTGVEDERAGIVRDVANVAPGERLLGVDLTAVQEDVTRLPWVLDVEVSRVPPSTVQLVVVVRAPVAVIAIEGASWLIDERGVVVAGGAQPDLPRILAPDAVLPGAGNEVSDAAVRNALAVHLELPPELRGQVDAYDAATDRGLRLHLADDDVWVRIGLADRVGAKAQAVTLLLEQARRQAEAQGSEDLGVAELDVRAPGNPVLVPGDGAPRDFGAEPAGAPEQDLEDASL